MADNDGNGGRQRWQTTMATDGHGLQDWAGDYDGEGQERAARDGGESGLAMMAAEKSCSCNDVTKSYKSSKSSY